MLNPLDPIVRQEQYKDLLREAARERLISSPPALVSQATRWLRNALIRLRCALPNQARDPVCALQPTA